MSSGIQGLCQYESAANNWELNYTAPLPPSTAAALVGPNLPSTLTLGQN